MLIKSFGECCPQIDEPHKTVDGQLKEFWQRLIENIPRKYLYGHRKDKEKKDEGWKMNLQ
jgi:hypothetical protein